MKSEQIVTEIAILFASAGRLGTKVEDLGGEYGFRVIVPGVTTADEMHSLTDNVLGANGYTVGDIDVCDGASLGYAEIFPPMAAELKLAA